MAEPSLSGGNTVETVGKLALLLNRYRNDIASDRKNDRELTNLINLLRCMLLCFGDITTDLAFARNRIKSLEDKLAAKDILSRIDVKSIEQEAKAAINKQSFF